MSLERYPFQYEIATCTLQKSLLIFCLISVQLVNHKKSKLLQFWKELLFLEILQEKINTGELHLCNLLSFLLTPVNSPVVSTNGSFYHHKRWCPSNFCDTSPINPEHNVPSTQSHDHTGSWACYCSGKCVMNAQMMNYAKARCQRWWNW